MKVLNYLAAISLLLVGCMVSYYAGRQSRQKDYEAACRMSDLIRCYEDHLSEDSLIQDWGCFEELEGLYLWDDAVGEPIDLKDYVYCY